MTGPAALLTAARAAIVAGGRGPAAKQLKDLCGARKPTAAAPSGVNASLWLSAFVIADLHTKGHPMAAVPPAVRGSPSASLVGVAVPFDREEEWSADIAAGTLLPGPPFVGVPLRTSGKSVHVVFPLSGDDQIFRWPIAKVSERHSKLSAATPAALVDQPAAAAVTSAAPSCSAVAAAAAPCPGAALVSATPPACPQTPFQPAVVTRSAATTSWRSVHPLPTEDSTAAVGAAAFVAAGLVAAPGSLLIRVYGLHAPAGRRAAVHQEFADFARDHLDIEDPRSIRLVKTLCMVHPQLDRGATIGVFEVPIATQEDIWQAKQRFVASTTISIDYYRERAAFGAYISSWRQNKELAAPGGGAAVAAAAPDSTAADPAAEPAAADPVAAEPAAAIAAAPAAATALRASAPPFAPASQIRGAARRAHAPRRAVPASRQRAAHRQPTISASRSQRATSSRPQLGGAGAGGRQQPGGEATAGGRPPPPANHRQREQQQQRRQQEQQLQQQPF